MNKHSFFVTTFLSIFLVLSFWVAAEEMGNPVAVSPGSETEAVTVWQNCPTFSWSSVPDAASYQVVVFESLDGKIMPYESMAIISVPVISAQITRPALSYTLSAEDRLKTGSMYAWYVQALDASGNVLGSWSNGRIFQVEQEIQFVGIREKLTEILRSYGVSDDTASHVLDEFKSEVPGNKNTPGISGILGKQGSYYTFYGSGAGASVPTGTMIYSVFVGDSSGSSITNQGCNTFLGHNAGTSNVGGNNTTVGSGAGESSGTTMNGSGITMVGKDSGKNNEYGDENAYIGAYTGYSNDHGSRYTLFGYKAGYSKTGYHEQPSDTFVGYENGYSTTSGINNAFLGDSAGYSNTSGSNSTYIGYKAGYSNTGYENTILGYEGGHSDTSGYYNTFLGAYAGYNNSGHANVFLGYKAGYNETNSNKLYIANSDTSSPLIYGDFNSNTITVNGNLGIGTNSPDFPVELEISDTTPAFVAARSSGAQNFLTATSSHAQFGSTSNHAVRILANDTWQMQVNQDNSLSMANGASCTTGGVWTDASSRTLKKKIKNLGAGEALATLFKLNPVKYNYKADKTDKHVGFIAEDVPDLVAAANKKGLSPMDITAVLTKVVQELQEENQEYKKNISELQERITALEKN